MQKINIVRFITLILLVYSNIIFAQEKVNISTGIGFPEYLNVGIHYQLSQIQLSIKYGAWPGKNTKAITSDIRLHLGAASELSTRRNWFILLGFNYWRNVNEIKIEEYTFISIRFGRDFNISRKFGISFSIGILENIGQNEVYKVSIDDGLHGGVDLSLLPGIGLELFYRI
ncbi:MAG: hypothetical protein K9J16_01965 [Melioribacteraceae bacterium]|nr:hypothetical protein [Melioribacteraceae bacterium]MCF8353032.1 hypothetical protein [Melioribacteraceae bacterium]MCF8392923.1 hypothetical protein [Melioribacteraceae bacterium]MCF8417783.1 hypothetical protein [Melioribacteraceae bacterium]